MSHVKGTLILFSPSLPEMIEIRDDLHSLNATAPRPKSSIKSDNSVVEGERDVVI